MNNKFYNPSKKFYDKTNCPIIINTSFNVRGEPIVCSPENALACFMSTNLDVLVMENFLILKDEQNKKLEKNTVFIIDNKNHLRNLKLLFKESNAGFFFRDNLWILIPNYKNKMSKNDRVVLMHTGGVPNIFAFGDLLSNNKIPNILD